MTAFKGGLKRIRTAVNGFADHWLSHSPIRPYRLSYTQPRCKDKDNLRISNYFGKEITPLYHTN